MPSPSASAAASSAEAGQPRGVAGLWIGLSTSLSTNETRVPLPSSGRARYYADSAPVLKPGYPFNGGRQGPVEKGRFGGLNYQSLLSPATAARATTAAMRFTTNSFN
jgi:hypothetical protein